MAKILIVDDDPGVGGMMHELLTRAGHEVRRAEDPSQMYAMTRDFVPELVIMDMQMPGGGAPFAQKVIDADERLSNTKILYHSNMPVEHVKSWFSEGPKRRFLHKGGPITDVRAAVADFLRS